MIHIGWPLFHFESAMAFGLDEADAVRARLVERIERLLFEAFAEPHMDPAEEWARAGPARLRARREPSHPLLPTRIVAPLESASRLEVLLAPLLTFEVKLECRLDLRPTLLFELLEFLLGDFLVVHVNLSATDGAEALPTVDLIVGIIRVDPQLGHFPVLLEKTLPYITDAHHVGELERCNRKLLERRHGHHTVTHGPLSFSPLNFSRGVFEVS